MRKMTEQQWRAFVTADARHLRELLMIGRLPESWLPPAHLLHLRPRVRLRHTLCYQRGEWPQRIQAVLYLHGCPQRRSLMTGDGRTWFGLSCSSPVLWRCV